MSVTHFESGDLFATGAEAIVNPVNCVGVMGKGLALAFKTKFPENFAAYADECRQRKLRPGGLFVFEQSPESVAAGGPRWIVNLATKNHWRDSSDIDWIHKGAGLLAQWARAENIQTVACPALGAGLGGLPWPEVKAAVEEAFDVSPTTLMLFAPQGPSPAPARRFYPR